MQAKIYTATKKNSEIQKLFLTIYSCTFSLTQNTIQILSAYIFLASKRKVCVQCYAIFTSSRKHPTNRCDVFAPSRSFSEHCFRFKSTLKSVEITIVFWIFTLSPLKSIISVIHSHIVCIFVLSVCFVTIRIFCSCNKSKIK